MKIRLLFLANIFFFSQLSFSQEADSTYAKTEITPQKAFIKGALSITNNGVSTVPYLSLGKPALIADMSLGKGRFSFDPQLRFNIPGARPWSFLFWFRYKLVDSDKFKFTAGTHPAYSFRTRTATINGVDQETITIWRFLAGELSSRYVITPNLSIGPYYLYAYNMEKYVANNQSHFIALQSSITNIRLTDQFYMGIFPQAYYLRVGAQQGFYVYANISFAKHDFPLSLSASANKEIKSDVAGSQSFIWNVTLTYSFKQYALTR